MIEEWGVRSEEWGVRSEESNFKTFYLEESPSDQIDWILVVTVFDNDGKDDYEADENDKDDEDGEDGEDDEDEEDEEDEEDVCNADEGELAPLPVH